jgi:hypothetical protein
LPARDRDQAAEVCRQRRVPRESPIQRLK